MTAACTVFLTFSLLCYLAASLLVPGSFLLRRPSWEKPGRLLLGIGIAIHAVGLFLHLLMSGQSPFSSVLVVISLLIVAVVAAALVLAGPGDAASAARAFPTQFD